MKIIKISKGETVNNSDSFTKKGKSHRAVFNFEQKPWQRIRKVYQVGILILIIIALVGFIFPPIKNIRFIIALGIMILYVLISKPLILPKKYFLKSVKLNRRTITFEYYGLPTEYLQLSKDNVDFYVYSYDKTVEIEYAKHRIIFTDATEMTDFLNKIVTITNLKFYQSTELGMNKELLKYKVLKKRKGTNLPT